MNKAYCYIPQTIDKKLSEEMPKYLPQAVGWTPQFIASLRGAYDAAHGFSIEGEANSNPLWTKDIMAEDYSLEEGESEQVDNFWEVVQELTDFRNQKKEEQVKSLSNFSDNKTMIWETISQHYPDLNLFYSRTAQLSHYFIQAIDNYIAQQEKLGNLLTRQQVINGVPAFNEDGSIATNEDGSPVMAINSDKLFSAVFNRFMADYSVRMNEVHSQEVYDHYQAEFEKIFNPNVWAALLITAKAQLKHMEGLKLSLTDNSVTDIDLSTLNDNNFADLYDPETSTRESWQIMTDCMSAYGNLSMEVRKALSNIYVQTNEKDGSHKIMTDDLGYPVRMNAMNAYQNLMDILRNCRSKSKMMKLIGNNSKFTGLYNELKGNETLQTQLYNNFRKIFQPYVQMQFEARKIKFYILNRTRAEQSIGNYLFGVKYNPMKGSIAETSRFHWRETDIQRLKDVLGAFVDKKENGKVVDSIWRKPSHEQKLSLLEAFNALGIQCSDKALDSLVSNRKKLAEVIKSLGNLAQYSGLKDLKADTTDNFNSWLTRKAADQKVGENQRKVQDIITKLEESGNGIVYESKCRTINGKGQSVTYYGDVQPNFMGDLLGKIQSFSEITSANDKVEARKEFREWLKNKYLSSTQFCDKFDANNNPIASGIKNFWLRTLWEEASAEEGKGSMFDDGSFTSQFQFMRVVTGKYDNASTPIPFENFTTKQHFQQLIGSYFALDTQANQVMSDYVYAPVFVLGDSGVCKVIKVKRKSNFDSYNAKGEFDSSSIIDELYNIYESELRRMTLFKDFVKQNTTDNINNNPNIEANSEKFTMLTFLNSEFKGRNYYELGVQEVKDAIAKYLDRSFNNFIRVGEAAGIIGNSVEEKRFSDITTIVKPNSNGVKKTVKLNERLKEFYYNTYLSNILQYQIFTGDLGFYKNVKDFQKRYKEVHAPGNILDVDATWNGVEVVKANANGVKAERVMYAKDVHVNTEEVNPAMMEVILKCHAGETAEVLQAIKEGVTIPKQDKEEEKKRQDKLAELLGSKYGIYSKFVNDVSQTDGQGFRHIDSFRNLMIMAGLWNDRKEALHQEISEINRRVIDEKRNITPEELEKISAYSTVIMPLKPYMFTMEKVAVTGENGRRDNIFIPVQHKYAEAILIPCLLPYGSKLRETAEFMGNNNIDLLGADTIVKVGMWGQTDIEKADSEGNVDISLNLSKAKIHELDYSDYRIQSNVPEHINVERALGTQVRKLIMGNIDMVSSKTYDYLKGRKFKITKDGAMMELDGRNLVSLYTSLIVANMMESFDKFKKNIQNEQKLSNLLTSAIVNNDRYSLHQLLDIALHDGKFTTPLYEGSIEHDTTAMIFSIFRKEVNKQDMKGGSAVQVSDWGITTKDEVTGSDRPLRFITDETNSNILYAEVEIPFKFSYKDSTGKEISLKFNDYCNTDGTFKVDKNGEKLIEKDFPGILDIVAYRIPSERDYSMLNCKVVRCTEMTAGGTIRVPAQGTTIAGFDFDIDKLYLIRKDFVKRKVALESHYTNQEKNDIFAKIYEDRPDIRTELSKIREEKEGWKDEDRYEHALNYYWDEMLERNPSMEDEDSYNKDKLFEQAAKDLGIWKEQEYEEKLIEYDFDKGVAQNSRVARNNLIFELMRQRLMDKETLRDRLTPGGFDNAKNAANYLKKLLEINEEQDAADPSTLLFYNQLNQVAAKLIGIFANQNTNHQLSSVVKRLDLSSPIIFDGMMGAKLLRSSESLKDLTQEQLREKVGKTLLGKEIQLSDGTVVDIDLNLAEFLAASVDAVKDPVLNYLNFNTTTASVGALLARMGYATKDIGVLFNQPIIKEICDVIQNSGGITTFATARNKILKNYSKDANEVKNANTSVTTSMLASQITSYKEAEKSVNRKEAIAALMKNEVFRQSQLSALKIFEQAYMASRELNKFISTTKFTASNAVGSTMGFFYNQQYVVEDYINQEESNLEMVIYESMIGANNTGNKSLDINTPRELLGNREEYIKVHRENPFAFEQCMYDLNKELLNILEKYYPYNKSIYSDRRNVLNDFLPSGNVLDAETIDNIHRETSQHLLTSTDSAFNPNAVCEVNDNYTNRDYYLYRFPIELFNRMKAGKLPSVISRYLGFSYSDYTDRNTNKTTKQLHISVNLSVEQADKNTFTDAWAQLALGNEESQNIAKGLFFHNYYKLGFGVGPYSFMQFTPLEVKNLLTVGRGYDRMSYLDFISVDNLDKLSQVSVSGRTPRSIVEFGYMFALNHPDNYKLVHRMPSEGNTKYASYFIDSTTKSLKNVFELNLDSIDKDTASANSEFVVSMDKETGDFKVYPVIMRGKAIYVAMIDGSYNFRGNLGHSSKVTYVKVPILGNKNISNIYASSLDEAIALRNEGRQKLEEIENELSREDQNAIIENEESEEIVSTDELLNGEAEEQLLSDETSEEAPVGENNATEISFEDSDAEQLSEDLMKCGKVTENYMINTLLNILEERTGKEYDRENLAEGIRQEINQKASQAMQAMGLKGTTISDTIRRQMLIKDLVDELQANINSGKTKVYTSLKQEIC